MILVEDASPFLNDSNTVLVQKNLFVVGDHDKKWMPPSIGQLKLNVDAPFYQSNAGVGFGCII